MSKNSLDELDLILFKKLSKNPIKNNEHTRKTGAFWRCSFKSAVKTWVGLFAYNLSNSRSILKNQKPWKSWAIPKSFGDETIQIDWTIAEFWCENVTNTVFYCLYWCNFENSLATSKENEFANFWRFARRNREKIVKNMQKIAPSFEILIMIHIIFNLI